MTEIVTPFAQFFDTSGAPLNNGAIYIGTAYLDAQTNPIAVYWDDALTIPAFQPIRTLNGYPVWNGAPARIFCNADNFSMTVQTSTGRTVWAVQDATSENTTSNMIFSDFAAPNGSSLVGFIQAGAGAVARTAQNKMRDIVSVKDFGATGDGATNDAPAFQAAINALIARGGGTLYVPFGVYRIKNRLQASCNAQQHISIIGDGRYQSGLDFSDNSSLGIEFSSTSMSDNQLPVFEVSKIGLITSRDNAGTALSFNYVNSNNIDASVKVSEVLIAQNVDRISDGGSGYGYWTTGIYINNARNSEVFDLHAYGEMNRAPNSSRGIWLAGESTAFVCSDSLLLEWTTGIEGTGTTEGIYLNNTDIVYCRYGARHIIATGAEPQFTAVGCSFNCANVGVWLSNSIGSVISDSFFFAAYVLDTGTWPEWTGVKVDGIESRFNKVENCTFSKEIQRTGDTTVGIDFNQGRAFSASGNHFFGFSGNQLTFGVFARSGVSNVRLGDDNVFEQVATHFSNSGTNSIRQPLMQRGQASVASGAVISFPQAFTAAPQVVAVHLGSNTAINVTVSGASTTGFTVHHNGGGSVDVAWIAVGD